MNKKTFVIIILVLAVVALVAYYIMSGRNSYLAEAGACRLSPAELSAELAGQWNLWQADFIVHPVLGATVWQPPYHTQFIGHHRLLVAFEDGHIVLAALLEVDCHNYAANFTLVDDLIFDFPLTQAEWNDLIKNYGDPTEAVRNYTNTPIMINGQLREFDQWTEVTENLFRS
ncbi:MAG: hypothetical protein WDZ85_00575 [Candidatus Paceibacterota bacterium]